MAKMEKLASPASEEKDDTENESSPPSTRTAASVSDDAVEVISRSSSLIVILPIPSVELILPNGSSVRTHYWQFRYRFDGSICHLQGTGPGIFVNRNNFRFVALDRNARCLIDFTNEDHNIVLDCTDVDGGGNDDDHDDNVRTASKNIAHVHWKEDEMKLVLAGIRQVADMYYFTDDADDNDAFTSAATTQCEGTSAGPSTAGAPWSLDVGGVLTYRFEGRRQGDKVADGTTTNIDASRTRPEQGQEETEWLEASLESPKFVLSDGGSSDVPTLVSIEGAVIGPSSFFGQATLRFSSVVFDSNHNSVPTQCFYDMQQFLYRVVTGSDG